MMQDIEEVFSRSVARHEMIRPGGRVLAAVSGGADSVLLLELLVRHRARCPITIHVAHLNHGLRGDESDADEEFVRALAARHAIPFTSGRADLTRRAGESSSLEERARVARRSFLTETARRERCDRIALGHTLDDQAETILMWILRGTGRGGLSGMEPITPEGIIRPLLALRRRQVREYLDSVGEPFRDDSTNEDPAHLRNRIRRRLIHLLDAEFPGSVETIASEASLLAAEDAVLDDEARLLLEGSAGLLHAPSIAAAPRALARRAVRLGAERSGPTARSLGRLHVEEIIDLASRGSEGAGVDLPGGWRAERRGDTVVFHSGAGRSRRGTAAHGEPEGS
jgi:tRNA(Ile)-lysidine synthase